jgi:hypothetical protein
MSGWMEDGGWMMDGMTLDCTKYEETIQNHCIIFRIQVPESRRLTGDIRWDDVYKYGERKPDQGRTVIPTRLLTLRLVVRTTVDTGDTLVSPD